MIPTHFLNITCVIALFSLIWMLDVCPKSQEIILFYSLHYPSRALIPGRPTYQVYALPLSPVAVDRLYTTRSAKSKLGTCAIRILTRKMVYPISELSIFISFSAESQTLGLLTLGWSSNEPACLSAEPCARCFF